MAIIIPLSLRRLPSLARQDTIRVDEAMATALGDVEEFMLSLWVPRPCPRLSAVTELPPAPSASGLIHSADQCRGDLADPHRI